MSERGPGPIQPSPASPDALGAGEREQFAYTLETRFAPHLEAATTAVREAERELTDARERLARAQAAAARAPYTSDPLVFMRQGVAEEVDGPERKTTGKKMRTSYRFLLDRSVELAGAEIQQFRQDQAAAERELRDGVEACRDAEQRAVATLEQAQLMQERVRRAEQAARQGLAVLVAKLGSN